MMFGRSVEEVERWFRRHSDEEVFRWLHDGEPDLERQWQEFAAARDRYFGVTKALPKKTVAAKKSPAKKTAKKPTKR